MLKISLLICLLVYSKLSFSLTIRNEPICYNKTTPAISLIEFQNGQRVPFDCENIQVEIYGDDAEIFYWNEKDYDGVLCGYSETIPIVYNQTGSFDIYIYKPGFEEIVIRDYVVEKGVDKCGILNTDIEIEFIPE